MPESEAPEAGLQGLGVWGWFAVAILLAFLASAVWYACRAWSGLGDVRITPVGWLFLALGVVVTVVVGAGLTGLLFYSSRKGRDF